MGLLLYSFAIAQAQENIDLSGKWSFQIDRENVGENEEWFTKSLQDAINLPGSMPEKLKGDEVTVKTIWTGSLYDSSYYYNPAMEKYRQEGNVKFPFFLTPDKHYVGTAWYQKEVVIPNDWKGKHIQLYLERPHIETTVWVNNKKVGKQYSLSVAHVYDLTDYLKKGKQTITIRIDNRLKEEYNVGQDSHSITDQTQGNWNGIVGKIELQSTPKTYFDDIQIFPNLSEKKANVKLSLKALKKGSKATVTLSAESFNTDKHHSIPAQSQEVVVNDSVQIVEMELPMGNEMLTWDEFDPALYKLTAQLTCGKESYTKEVQFGMREITIEGKWIYINGRKTMMRGTVENCDFPLTGYAPMDVESWLHVFSVCKNYGLNHMRFHSFCPPEAAFIAADLVGVYIQPEGPSWPNHGSSLGRKRPIDTYLMDETIAMAKQYGNYASWCMLACGNEPSGNWVEWVSDFVDYWKAHDSRRIYTGASVGGGWAWQPNSQYHVKAGARGLNWDRTMPESRSTFTQNISKADEPWISHETGQWCVFPNFNEIDKYTGVNKAKNFEIFRDLLNDNGMGELAQHFTMASGKLQALCYKHEIEKTMRTPDYAGFQLLALNDYSGQGSAIVGLTDVFFDEKDYISPEQFRRFCSATVPLAKTDKFVYQNNETLNVDIEVAHFGKEALMNATATYRLTNEYGLTYSKGVLCNKEIPIGGNFALGTISIALDKIEKAQKLNLEISIKANNSDETIANDWDFWVYPAEVEIAEGDVYITDTLDNKAIEILEKGGNVLITAAGKISFGANIQQHFTPVFWNTSWFKMRPPHTTGIYTNSNHPLFKEFPTDYHSNLQWWELLNRAQVMQFSDFPKDFQPLVQSIDTWFISRKIGMLFEANVLNGKVIMTSMDITNFLDKRIVARQLRKTILDYMNSDQFRPASTISPEQIGALFTKASENINSYTKGTPDELKPKIKAGDNQPKPKRN